MTRIVLTGGGTAGHVMPHVAMLPAYKEEGWEVYYVGGKGMERALIENEGVPYHAIQTGKLRRYFSVENAIDIFRIFAGFAQSLGILVKLRPDIVFSKGGFVSVPVAFAAKLLRIPVVSHESDLTPGLANKLIEPICSFLFYAFPETKKYIKIRQNAEAGIPVRPKLFHGNRDRGLTLCGFSSEKPVLLVMGGSLGAERVNQCLLEALPRLIADWQVVHLTGKGKSIPFTHPHYKAFEFLSDGLEDVFAATDAVLSRAGANSLFELKALQKPMLLIPLEIGSRGDQLHNARSFEQQGWALVQSEKSLTAESLIQRLGELRQVAPRLREAMQKASVQDDGGRTIIQTLKGLLQKK